MKRILFFWLFFLSGFSALVYEVVWARQLVLVFGNTVYAVSTILTIFFAGLALGSYLFGRLIDKKREQSLLFYGLVELGIGVYAALTPWIFKLIESAQVGLAYRFEPSYSSFSLFTFVLSFFGLIFPTVLMGGTLPVISRFLANSETKSGEVMGNLYGLNTLGGVFGVLLAGFWLIPSLGVRETIWLAAAINLLIGIIVLASSGERLAFRGERLGKKDQKKLYPKPYTLNPILLAFFLTGFAALALEVLWTRVLILVFGASTYALTIILAVFLLGIALGSFLSSRFLVGRKNLVGWLFLGLVLLGAGVILMTPLLPQLPFYFLNFYTQSSHFTNNLWASFVISFLTILPLTTLMGMIFPLGIRLAVVNFQSLGKDLGRLYSVNTFGGILGSFIAGFIFIPFWGLQKGILVAASFYLLTGGLMLWFFSFSQKLKTMSLGLMVLLAAGAFFLPAWDRNILSSGVFVYFQDYLEAKEVNMDPARVMKSDKILYYKEGLSATVAVKSDGQNTYLRINGKTDASTTTDLETVLLLGHLPLLLHPNPQNVLVVGLGSGITLGAVEQHPIKKVDVVEIEPAIVQAARFFNQENHSALDDPRLKVIVGDGRNYLATTRNKYDVISSEPSNPWVKGNADLFTREYFQLAKEHLLEGGLFLQWLHNYSLDQESLKVALATFRSIFPNVTVWSPLFSNDLLLIGSDKPLTLDMDLLEKKFGEEKVKNDLQRVSIKEPSCVLGLFLFNGEGVKHLTEGVRIHQDNWPILEYLAPFSLGKATVGSNLELLLRVQQEPYSYVKNLSRKEKTKIKDNMELKTNIFQGKIMAEKGHPESSLEFFSKALALDPNREQVKKAVAQAYFNQAQILYTQKNLAGAKENLLKVIKFDPSYAKAHLNLGVIYYLEGNISEAASQWAIAKELDPESEEVEKNLELLEKHFPN